MTPAERVAEALALGREAAEAYAHGLDVTEACHRKGHGARPRLQDRRHQAGEAHSETPAPRPVGEGTGLDPLAVPEVLSDVNTP